MKKKLILVGGGGHAKVVIDAVDQAKYEIVGILDKDNSHLHERINNIEIIGIDSQSEEFLSLGIKYAFVAIGHIGNPRIRNMLFSQLQDKGFEFINIVHRNAILSDSVRMGKGNLIMAGSILNAESCIGSNNIINTGAILEHEVVVKNGVHIAPGTVLAGGSKINDNVFIGAGSTVIQGVSIGKNSIIGAGSVVIHDIPENVVAVGNPVRIIKYLE